MPQSPGFKPYVSCSKPMPMSGPHSNCLKCLGEIHVKDKCKVCRDFRPHTKKNQEFRLKAILMEAAFRPVSQLSRSALVPSTSASVQSGPPARVPRVSGAKEEAQEAAHQERAPAGAEERQGGEGIAARPELGYQTHVGTVNSTQGIESSAGLCRHQKATVVPAV